jgi:CRISPR system Cascade subunit CasE
MYLSKLTVDPRNAQARRDLADAYEMHRTLARVFVRDDATPPVRFLWRLERRSDDQASCVVLVQSAHAGDWAALNAMPGYVDQVQPNKAVDLDALVQTGARYRFRLLANPTVTREGKRYGLTRENEQLAWIARQGERNGFSVLGCVRGADERLQVRQGRGGNRIILHTALFDGVLQVDSAELLRQGVLNGFGHGKAMGLGLLSLARAQ